MGILKLSIRWALNHLSRTFLQHTAEYSVPVLGLFYIGHGHECPICGVHRRKFLPYGYVTSRENALCPKCLSLERHRLLWLYLQRETTLLNESSYPTILHIAPESCLKHQFETRYSKHHSERYITADLESPLARLHFDIQSIPLKDESVDVVICNHILEHVIDDNKALSELYRVMRTGGWGVLLSPIDTSIETTIEDEGASTPEERTLRFGQYDHYRLYGRDYPTRLSKAGFKVEDINYAATLSIEERDMYGLSDEHLYIVRKN